MEIEIVLFTLRVVAGVALFALFCGLIYFLWRDYQGAATQVEAQRRIYGALVALTNEDGSSRQEEQRYPLLMRTTIGRAPTNTIQVLDSFASSEHALIYLQQGQWWLEDRRSKNGTRLNGDDITEPVVITHGDIITIGNINFRLELNY
ncbi:MAG: FHA domain-containing protein [Chloroflexi bacterium]|nr:MAG: FHA domain-containing protein [Chloroflexota bacterium]